VRVIGEVRGKDILEPLGRVLQKSRLNVELAPGLDNLIVSRPTAYVLARQVSIVDSKEEAYDTAINTARRKNGRRSKKSDNSKITPVSDICDSQTSGQSTQEKPVPLN
jgi:hypothetical protein